MAKVATEFTVNAKPAVTVKDKDGNSVRVKQNETKKIADYDVNSLLPLSGNGKQTLDPKDKKKKIWVYRPSISFNGDLPEAEGLAIDVKKVVKKQDEKKGEKK